MSENKVGLKFFLKSPKTKGNVMRYVHVRVTVDGKPKDASTKRKWDSRRWDQHLEKATGNKEDARSLNYYLESLVTNINNYKVELVNKGLPVTAKRIIDFVNGKSEFRVKVLEEFQKHNDEMFALVPTEYAKGTYERYVTARSHVEEFIKFKYKRDDIEFRELNFEFVKDYDFYLKTVRKCSHNTTLKYISNFKKIVLLAIAKEIIPTDPFKLFKCKKEKVKKKPLTKAELEAIENKEFTTQRLSIVRDLFIFQCYTGMAYIDIFQLRKEDIVKGDDGNLWIMSNREKTDADTNIPLLPKAIEIMEKYKDDPICVKRGSILPVRSNQKMNEYLKEIQTLCEVNPKNKLDTHRGRRTFASTVALKNGVPIHIVQRLLGHHSVTQTEDYAITEQEAVGQEMKLLREKLSSQMKNSGEKLQEGTP